VLLTSDSEFIAERPMYFAYHGKWSGGHDVLGANAAATTWFFAEGTTRAGFDEWLCLQNRARARRSGRHLVPASASPSARLHVDATEAHGGRERRCGPNQDISCKWCQRQAGDRGATHSFSLTTADRRHDVAGFVPVTREVPRLGSRG